MKKLFIIGAFAMIALFTAQSCKKQTNDLQVIDQSNGPEYEKIKGKATLKIKFLRPAPTNGNGETCACGACFGVCGTLDVILILGNQNIVDLNDDGDASTTITHVNVIDDSHVNIVLLQPASTSTDIITIDEENELPSELFAGTSSEGSTASLINGEYLFDNNESTINIDGISYPTYGSMNISFRVN